MSKYRLVSLAGNKDTIPEIELENFEFDKTKNHVIAFTIDVNSVEPLDVLAYIKRVKKIVRPAFPKNVKLIFIPRRHNDLTGVWKVL